jgi:hypothetical protein
MGVVSFCPIPHPGCTGQLWLPSLVSAGENHTVTRVGSSSCPSSRLFVWPLHRSLVLFVDPLAWRPVYCLSLVVSAFVMPLRGLVVGLEGPLLGAWGGPLGVVLLA